jgi:polyribonucleotide nucleotidyltransferase
MGLITEGDRRVILTDIMGREDALGDMDFKVAGTRAGVTALQLDLKIPEIDPDVLRQALAQAREARFYALDRMDEVLSAAREDLSPYAPRITMIKIDPQKIGLVIGPGGKTIRRIIEETGVKIDVEDDGTVIIAGTDAEGSRKAVEMVRGMTEEPEIGKIYTGTVKRITDFGAFVEILPGTDGLVHVSQLADYHVANVEDVVRVGDEIMVMVVDIDSEDKIRLSRRAVLEGWTPEEARAMDRKPGQRRKPQRPRRERQFNRRGG